MHVFSRVSVHVFLVSHNNICSVCSQQPETLHFSYCANPQNDNYLICCNTKYVSPQGRSMLSNTIPSPPEPSLPPPALPLNVSCEEHEKPTYQLTFPHHSHDTPERREHPALDPSSAACLLASPKCHINRGARKEQPVLQHALEFTAHCASPNNRT